MAIDRYISEENLKINVDIIESIVRGNLVILYNGIIDMPVRITTEYRLDIFRYYFNGMIDGIDIGQRSAGIKYPSYDPTPTESNLKNLFGALIGNYIDIETTWKYIVQYIRPTEKSLPELEKRLLVTHEDLDKESGVEINIGIIEERVRMNLVVLHNSMIDMPAMVTAENRLDIFRSYFNGMIDGIDIGQRSAGIKFPSYDPTPTESNFTKLFGAVEGNLIDIKTVWNYIVQYIRT